MFTGSSRFPFGPVCCRGPKRRILSVGITPSTFPGGGIMSLERPWLQSYPDGVPAEIDVNEFHSVSAVFDASVAKFRDRPAYSSFGKVLTYGETDALVE